MNNKNQQIQNFYNNYIQSQNPDFYEEFRWHSTRYKSEQYWDTFRFIMRMFDNKYVKHGDDLLEIGGGVGTWTRVALKLNVGSLTDIDISKSMIQQAKLNLGQRENLKFINADFTQVPDNDLTIYDSALAIRCFEYFEDKNSFFRSLNRSIKNEGHAIIVTKKKPFRKPSRKQHQRQVSTNRIIEFARKNNFSLVEQVVVSYDARVPFFGKVFFVSKLLKKFFPNGGILLNFFVESWGFVFVKSEN